MDQIRQYHIKYDIIGPKIAVPGPDVSVSLMLDTGSHFNVTSCAVLDLTFVNFLGVVSYMTVISTQRQPAHPSPLLILLIGKRAHLSLGTREQDIRNCRQLVCVGGLS